MQLMLLISARKIAAARKDYEVMSWEISWELVVCWLSVSVTDHGVYGPWCHGRKRLSSPLVHQHQSTRAAGRGCVCL